MNKQNKIMFQGFVLTATALLMTLGTGCAGYRLGNMLPGDVKTVFVPSVENRSSEPLIEVELTRAIIRQIQQDGSLRIAAEEEADAILTVVLNEYRLEAVAFRSDDRAAANQYRINLEASMVMRRTRDQSVVAQAPRILGSAVFDVAGDLTTSKQTGNPQAANQLADRIVQRVVEYW
ncbi:MAG TPA: LptE family protein [Kiritimatiellia bacterium]|nr:LptE family protein [Kiritimatiellia bacterium]HMO97932.1 LptE family protein [Kiritimatiellia bacterium]HMP95283.1 LptE family protein [Kiritimatiellia bacterium]